ncbi:MAG: glycosyltransferase family 2 protein [Chloroflexi bacterium]|nr:glycosyltransferase family 2 protein [Chloroflexota bacterium]
MYPDTIIDNQDQTTGMRARQDTCQLSIVIVNWNTRQMLLDCLASIYQHTHHLDFEVIVVDNGSIDGSPDSCAKIFPQVKLLTQQDNLGFSRGTNAGVLATKGEQILLLNTDTLVLDGALERLVCLLAAHPEVGCIGPRLIDRFQVLQRSSAGLFPTLRTAFNYLFFTNQIFPRQRFFQGLFLPGELSQVTEVDWISSACMLLRRQALFDIGLLPTIYPAFLEDTECCRLLKEEGWIVLYDPTATVVHYANGTTRKVVQPHAPNAWRSLSTYFHMHNGPRSAFWLQPMGLLGFGVRWAGYTLAGRRRKEGATNQRADQSLLRLKEITVLLKEMLSGQDWHSVR